MPIPQEILGYFLRTFDKKIETIKNENPPENLINKLSFGECIAKFREELIQEEIEINPDDIWDDIRNYLARKNSCISRWTSK